MAAPTKSFTALERISTKVRPMVSQLALAASRVRGPAKYSYGGGGEGGGGEGGGEGSGGEGGGGEGGGGKGSAAHVQLVSFLREPRFPSFLPCSEREWRGAIRSVALKRENVKSVA